MTTGGASWEHLVERRDETGPPVVVGNGDPEHVGHPETGAVSDGDRGPGQDSAQPGAVHGMVAWYRAMIPALFRRFRRRRIAAPTLLLWGKRDPFLSSAMAQPSVALCERGKLVMLDDATHWLHWDAPDRVNALIGDWLADGASPEAPRR